MIKTLLTDGTNSEKFLQLTAADKIYDPAGIRDHNVKANMSIVLDSIDMLRRQEVINSNPQYVQALKTIYHGIMKTHHYYQAIIDQYINEENSQPITIRPINPVLLSERISEKINSYFLMENINSRVYVNKADSPKDVLSHYDSLAGVITGVVSVISECAKSKSDITIDFDFSNSAISIIISEKENSYEALLEFLSNPLNMSETSAWKNSGVRAKYRKIIDFMYINNGEISYGKTGDKGISFVLKFNSVTDKLMDDFADYDANEVIKRMVEDFFVNIDI